MNFHHIVGWWFELESAGHLQQFGGRGAKVHRICIYIYICIYIFVLYDYLWLLCKYSTWLGGNMPGGTPSLDTWSAWNGHGELALWAHSLIWIVSWVLGAPSCSAGLGNRAAMYPFILLLSLPFSKNTTLATCRYMLPGQFNWTM